LLRPLFATFMSQAAADNAGPGLASMLIYFVMAIILLFRPQGLFPQSNR
jgi:branched-chain amino acid transport system permease protein